MNRKISPYYHVPEQTVPPDYHFRRISKKREKLLGKRPDKEPNEILKTIGFMKQLTIIICILISNLSIGYSQVLPPRYRTYEVQTNSIKPIPNGVGTSNGILNLSYNWLTGDITVNDTTINQWIDQRILEYTSGISFPFWRTDQDFSITGNQTISNSGGSTTFAVDNSSNIRGLFITRGGQNIFHNDGFQTYISSPTAITRFTVDEPSYIFQNFSGAADSLTLRFSNTTTSIALVADPVNQYLTAQNNTSTSPIRLRAAAPIGNLDLTNKDYTDSNLRGVSLPSISGQAGNSIRVNGTGTAWEYYTPFTQTIADGTYYPLSGDFSNIGNQNMTIAGNLNFQRSGTNQLTFNSVLNTIRSPNGLNRFTFTNVQTTYQDGNLEPLKYDALYTIGGDVDIPHKSYVDSNLDGAALPGLFGSIGESLRIDGTGTGWEYYTPSTGGIDNIVEDVTPQLGGNLDLNTFNVGAATAADLTKLNGITSTVTELNYTDGVTSPIQTQLDDRINMTIQTNTITYEANPWSLNHSGNNVFQLVKSAGTGGMNFSNSSSSTGGVSVVRQSSGAGDVIIANDNTGTGDVLIRRSNDSAGDVIISAAGTGNEVLIYQSTDIDNLSDSAGVNKKALVDYVAASGSTWGDITGTLSNQTDLQNALNTKIGLPAATYNVTGSGSWSVFTGVGSMTIGATAGSLTLSQTHTSGSLSINKNNAGDIQITKNSSGAGTVDIENASSGDVSLTASGTGTITANGSNNPASRTDSTIVNEYRLQQFVNNIKIDTINIGAWDMDATANLSVDYFTKYSITLHNRPHGIISITIFRDDGAAPAYPLTTSASIGGQPTLSGGYAVDGNDIELSRTTSGLFDSVNYDDAGVNRGIITFWYME